jgi:hypothetical protein
VLTLLRRVLTLLPCPLYRYAVGRASVGDVQSVAVSCALVSELLRQMLKFDFRNGDLRRRYDSVKYCVRRMEDMLCALLPPLPSLSPARLQVEKRLGDRAAATEQLRIGRYRGFGTGATGNGP